MNHNTQRKNLKISKNFVDFIANKVTVHQGLLVIQYWQFKEYLLGLNCILYFSLNFNFKCSNNLK